MGTYQRGCHRNKGVGACSVKGERGVMWHPHMEYLPRRPPCLWLRFVDDIFVIQATEHSQQLLQHINSQDPNMQFTVDEPDQEECLPSLDTKVTPGPNNTLNTTFYRKPMHTDWYLHWDCNHFIAARHSVYNTLAHKAKVVSSKQPSVIKVLEHIKMALQSCHFPAWTLNKLQHNFEYRHCNNIEPISTDSQHNNHNNSGTSGNNNNRNISTVVPYIQGLGEKFKSTCSKKGIQIHFKGSNTIKTLLMAPKDKNTKLQKNGVIYIYKCLQINGPEQYIGETGRAFGNISWPHPLPPTHQYHRKFNQPWLFQQRTQGVTRYNQKYQRSHVHQGKWPLFKQEVWQVPTVTCMGPNSPGHSSTSI